jgi:SEC-C motif-containing protein
VELDPEQHWVQLEILGSSRGGLLQSDGVVEFRAHYRRRADSGTVRERSRFRRENGLWTYLDGVSL